MIPVSSLHPVQDHRQLVDNEFWRLIPAYGQVSADVFCDHLWQLKNSVTSVKDLLTLVREVVSEEFFQDVMNGFHVAPMAVRVSPYLLSLINWRDPYNDPLRKQFIPLKSTMEKDHPELNLDSLHEQDDSPVPGLTHRYQDKALFLALDICPVYCRYCTRSYAVGFDTAAVEKVKFSQDLERYNRIFDYIRAHPQIEDVVVSGGDAYMLRPERLKLIGDHLLAIPHVRRMRIATKGPAVMPMKILSDTAWYKVLVGLVNTGRRLHKEVCLHTHFSHPNEITSITKAAMDRLMEDGVTVRNQAVLQRGVNDSSEIMTMLTKRLGYLNVHPYYVYMHDLVRGVEELRTTLSCGIEIEKAVRGVTAGFNTPTFVVDAPGGGGKRVIHSYEYYNKETGIAVYTAPSVKPGKHFMYFDPLSKLSDSIQKDWQDPARREEMKHEALRSI